MVLFPVVAALVSLLFAVSLLRQFGRSRRFPQLAWGIALLMYAIASLAVAGGVSGGWDPTLYRVFWLFGALLNVPWLALGSIALVANRPVRVAAFVAVVIGSLWGIAKVAGGTIDPAIFTIEGIPRGSQAWSRSPEVRTLASVYSIPAWLVVVGIAVLSSRSGKARRIPVERVRANWLIALGVTIVAIGGFALSRVGGGSAFSISLAAGVVVMFAGFLMASRAPRPVRPDATPTE